MSKETYEVTIKFEYDSEDGAPLTGKPITHADQAIEAVRDELELISPHEFSIECKVFVDGEHSHSIQG